MSQGKRDDVLAYREARDPRAISRKVLRREFLRQPEHVRRATQERVARLICAGSALARYAAEGVYADPRPGELAALEQEIGS